MLTKRAAIAGYEAANLGSHLLRPFAPSGAPSVLPRAPSMLSNSYNIYMDRHITLSAKSAIVDWYNTMIYPVVMPLDARYQYEF